MTTKYSPRISTDRATSHAATSTTSEVEIKENTQPTESEDNSNNDDTEQHYKPRSLKFWLVILNVYLSFFLIALDRMIIATAIPAITNTFNSIDDIGWYGSAYMLTCAICNPLYGKIYQLYDTKWTYLVAIIIFEAGSALCGAAPSSSARENSRCLSTRHV